MRSNPRRDFLKGSIAAAIRENAGLIAEKFLEQSDAPDDSAEDALEA